MKKRNVIILCISVVLTFCYIGRVYYVNVNAERVPIIKYKMGDIVPYEKDLANGSVCDGYTIQVKDCKLQSAEEFFESNNITETDLGEIAEFYIIVNVSVANTNTTSSEEYGVSLFQLALTGTDYSISFIDEGAFELLNPDMPGCSFSLQPESSLDMTVVYDVGKTGGLEMDDILNDNPKMEVTGYPNRKVIELEL